MKVYLFAEELLTEQFSVNGLVRGRELHTVESTEGYP